MKTFKHVLFVLFAVVYQGCSGKVSLQDETPSTTVDNPNLVETTQENLYFYFMKFQQEAAPVRLVGVSVGSLDNIADDYLRKFKPMDYATANDFKKNQMRSEAETYITDKLAQVDLRNPIILKASFGSFDRYDFEKGAFHVQSGSISRNGFQFPAGAVGGMLPIDPSYQEYVAMTAEKAEKLLGNNSTVSVDQWLIARLVKGADGKAYLKIDKAVYSASKGTTVIAEQVF
jgi:hypothetical protein